MPSWPWSSLRLVLTGVPSAAQRKFASHVPNDRSPDRCVSGNRSRISHRPRSVGSATPVLYRCTDLTLSQARWSWRDSNSLVPRREPSEEDREDTVFISCSEDPASPFLEIKACRFALSNQTEGPHEFRWGLALSGRPSEAAICQWMERQIATETATGFEAAMDRLLLRVVRQPQTGMQAKWQIPLLSELLMMRCMWKVWSCKQLFVRLHPESQAFPLDVRVSTIQDSLLSFAAQAISERERKILRGIQQLFFEKKDKDTDEMTIIKWLLLWQMMLLYRQSLSWMLAQAQPFSLPGWLTMSNVRLRAC